MIIYPEGTATRDPDLWPMAAKTGVARLALATGAPVIPVARWGTQNVLPYGIYEAQGVATANRAYGSRQAGRPVGMGRQADLGTGPARRHGRDHDRGNGPGGIPAGEEPPAIPFDMSKSVPEKPSPTNGGSMPPAPGQSRNRGERLGLGAPVQR